MEKIFDGYRKFVVSELPEESSQKGYIKIVKDFLKQFSVIDEQANWQELFSMDSLTMFSRKTTARRAALSMLLDYLYTNGKIDKTACLLLKSNVEDAYPSEKHPRKSILSDETIDFLFGEQIQYRDDEERVTSRIVIALGYFCMLKQGQIMQLKMNQVDIQNKRIENPNLENGSVTKWVKLDDKVVDVFCDYIEFRRKCDAEEFVVYRGDNLTNNIINSLIAVVNRKDNKHLFYDDNINIDALVKKRMYDLLVSTNGKALVDLRLFAGVQNSTLLDVALENFLKLSSVRELYETLTFDSSTYRLA